MIARELITILLECRMDEEVFIDIGSDIVSIYSVETPRYGGPRTVRVIPEEALQRTSRSP